MRKYNKPFIEDETIILEDIIAASNEVDIDESAHDGDEDF